jgi:hypothetical protein
VDFALRSYATNVEGPASFFTADSLFVVTSQSERFYAQVSAVGRQQLHSAAVTHQRLSDLHDGCQREGMH